MHYVTLISLRTLAADKVGNEFGRPVYFAVEFVFAVETACVISTS